MHSHNTLDVLSRIKGELFIGNSSAARNYNLLKTHNISHVLICCSEVGPAFPDKLIYKKLNIQETFDFNIFSHFDEAYEFIDAALNNGHGVVAHCVQGQSRSPTIVIAYLMKKYKLPCKKAMKIVAQKHPQTQPNGGFVEQLNSYEKILNEANPPTTCSVCGCVIQ